MHGSKMISSVSAIVTALVLSGSLMGAPGCVRAAAFDIEFEEVASGVWVGIRPDGPRFPVMGTTVFVISDEGVVVFDGGGMPIMAEKVIDKIRSLTDAPVTHVVISHWHGDHNFGIYRFDEEYPNVQFVAHSFTHAVMHASRIRYIDSYPEFITKNLPIANETLRTGLAQNGDPLSLTDRKEYERMVADADQIDAEFNRAKVTSPNVVFDDALTIDSGGRRIELMKVGHGNTEGDIVMWLPDEKIVATGDIVVLPTPYAFNVPPRPWAETLRNINKLGYKILIPGHEKIKEQLDFTSFEQRFTGGDEYLRGYYIDYFE